MARPSKPLISRSAAVDASIAIIDSEGLNAFSLPRLAAHMGVRAPSLYHHFADKNAILTAVARHIAGKSVIKPRRAPGPDWPEYFVSLALNFRQSVLRHRNAASVLIEHLPRETLIGSFEDAAQFPPFDPDKFPNLAEAIQANDLTVKELFAERIRSFLYGVTVSDTYRSGAEETSA